MYSTVIALLIKNTTMFYSQRVSFTSKSTAVLPKICIVPPFIPKEAATVKNSPFPFPVGNNLVLTGVF